MKRTPKEIRRWFRANLWYSDFLRHAWFGRRSIKSAIDVITGRCGFDTLTEAFAWDKTLRGYSFWSLQNSDFQHWYLYGAE